MPLSSPAVASAGGYATLGRYGTALLAAGAANDYLPVLTPAWPSGYGRLDLDTTAGVANLTGLIAGADGQIVLLTNIGANALTLNALNAGSAAANRFRYAGDLVLPQWASALAVYFKGTVNMWVLR